MLSESLEALRQDLGIDINTFLKNRYHNLLVEVINSSPNKEIQQIIIIFLKKYLQQEYTSWAQVLNSYSTKDFLEDYENPET